MKPQLKIYLLLIFIIIFIISNTFVLKAQTTVWRQIIGEQYNERGYDVIELSDKGYLMIGTKELLIPGTNFLTIQPYLVRLDKKGNMVWQKTIGDSINPSFAGSIIEDSQGNIYLPCEISSIAHLIKMNSSGVILWNKEYSKYNIERFAGISFIDSYSKFMLVGQSSILKITTSSLTKLDTSGNLIWSRSYYDSIPSIYAYSSTINCYLFTENSYYLTGSKGINGFIIKTDTSGNIIWNKNYLQAQIICSIALNSENTFVATGRARNFGTYCIKFDNNGDTIWTKNFGLGKSNYYGVSKIEKIYNGNFAIGTGGVKIGVLDSLGSIIFEYRNSYPGDSIIVGTQNLNSTSDSGLVLTGFYSTYQNGDFTKDVLIYNVDRNGNMVSIKNNNEILSDNFVINTFPNPFNLSFKLNFNLTKDSKIKVDLYDISGKKVREIENKNLNIGNHQYLINTPELSSGIYFLKFNNNNRIYSKKILLIK